MYVFTDRPIPFTVPENLHVLQHPLTDFVIYQKCMREWSTGKIRLPVNRNATKDTAEFMALMNTKVEMVWRAIPLFHAAATHVAWIDAGIMKIVKSGDARTAFADHRKVVWPDRKITMPGCWGSPLPPSSDGICWRFCGGFFVAPVALFGAFYEAVNAVLESWLCAGHLVWEVNIWADLDWQEPAWFCWFGADHNLRMLVAPEFLTRG